MVRASTCVQSGVLRLCLFVRRSLKYDLAEVDLLRAQPTSSESRRGLAGSEFDEPRAIRENNDYYGDEDDMLVSGFNGHRGQWNNLALGNLTFKHVPSQLIASNTKHSPRIGDVCVRVMPVIHQSEEYSSIVDLYNTYISKGSALIAQRCINSYASTSELLIPAIPIHTFVAEWNKSLQHFHDMIRCDGSGPRQSLHQRRLIVVANVTEIALKNVPILSDHLWFVLHSIVSKPSLVKQVIQLVGAVASTSGAVYHTGDVDSTTVPGEDTTRAVKLYLLAKSVPSRGNDVTVLGDEAGATLGLIWVAHEEELHDHLRNSQDCYYLHIGTKAGNSFKCNVFCEWRYYNHGLFTRMAIIGQETVSLFDSSVLAGNTGDSARLLNRT